MTRRQPFRAFSGREPTSGEVEISRFAWPRVYLPEVRIGYIGLSTPLAYDYSVDARRAPSDLHSSPNPLLDSPYGLMLLYDELWFLCD